MVALIVIAVLLVPHGHSVAATRKLAGAGSSGTPALTGAGDRVDIVTGTFGKTLGGGMGGFVAAAQPIVDLLRQRARPYLFSNSLSPPIAAGALKALEMGADILQTIPELHPIIPIVSSHHERWDGTGYPDRLKADDIPFLARIVAVADAFDAMTSNRPYHVNGKAKPPGWAFGEVERQSGRQFDPRCARAFISMREEIVRTMLELMPGTELDDSPAPVVAEEFVLDPRN